MATSGTNYTGKWTLSNGVLTLAPASGSSGQFRSGDFNYFQPNLLDYITLTKDERNTVESIVFSGDVSFYNAIYGGGYSKQTSYVDFINYYDWGSGVFPNLTSIDVSGWNVSGGKDFRRLFESLDTLIGLSNLDVSAGTNFGEMFVYAKLSSLDVSHFPLTSATNIYGMFSGMGYCTTITLPSDFSRTSTGDTTYPYYFGLAPATNANGITVRKDEDFFKLPSGQQGGLWTRDISGTAKLRFSVSGTTREADKATITYSYATSTATGSLYIKKSSESSFPSEPAETFTLTGTGTGSIEITLPTDDSYDVWIVVTDGNETIYTYPSIDSNILLFKIKKDKTVEDGEGYSIPHVEEGTTSITTTTGVLDSHAIIRYGRMRQLRIAVHKTSATAAGSNLYQGKINTESDRPLIQAYGSGYMGSAGTILYIAPTGDITVRVIGAQMAANNSPWLGVTYIAQGD